MKYIKQNKTFLEKWLKTWKFLIKLLIIIIFLLSFHKNFDFNFNKRTTSCEQVYCHKNYRKQLNNEFKMFQPAKKLKALL